MCVTFSSFPKSTSALYKIFRNLAFFKEIMERYPTQKITQIVYGQNKPFPTLPPLLGPRQHS